MGKHTNGDSTMHHCSLDMTQVEAPLDEQQVGQTSPSDVLQLKNGQASPTDVLQVDVGSALIHKQPPASPTDALLSPVSASINRLRRAPRCQTHPITPQTSCRLEIGPCSVHQTWESYGTKLPGRAR